MLTRAEIFIRASFYFVKKHFQRAKKVLSDSPGLVDFAIGLVNSVFNLPDGQVMFYEELQKNKKLLGLVEMTSGLVNASISFPEGQAVKMIFFLEYPIPNCRHSKQPTFRNATTGVNRKTSAEIPY